MPKTETHFSPAALGKGVTCLTAEIPSRMQGVYFGEALTCGVCEAVRGVLQQESVLDFRVERRELTWHMKTS
jgi:hypothetical protein